MNFFLFASLGTTLMGIVLSVVALFMILLILVQRGRGGGLAGALGGMGGSSAFGAKAGDVFTKITAWAAFGWILLCLVAAMLGGPDNSSRISTGASTTTSVGSAAEDKKDESKPGGQPTQKQEGDVTTGGENVGEAEAGEAKAGESAAGAGAAEDADAATNGNAATPSGTDGAKPASQPSTSE